MKSRIRSLVQGHSGRATAGIAAGLALVVVAAVVALLIVVAGPSGTTSANDVTPVLVDGNPDCNGQNELVRIDPVSSGTFSVAGGTITIVVNSSAKTFDWTSTVGIDFILVKGGPNANLYVYNPPAASFGDTGLHAPTNSKNGRFFGLSHISFCGPGGPTATPETPTATPETPTATPITPTATPITPTPTITATPEFQTVCTPLPLPLPPGVRDPCPSATETPEGPTFTPPPPSRD